MKPNNASTAHVRRNTLVRRMARRIKTNFKELLAPLTYRNRSYAQEGEDMVLRRLFEGQRRGFYVEVGCHHPFRFSNTASFYRMGWQGLCIDPLPGTRALFNRWRPRDIVLEMGVSQTPSALTYYMFDEPALNTFSAEQARACTSDNRYALKMQREVPTLPLSTLLEQHLPKPVPQIDFLSVDAEGMDLEVLRSNDWQRWRPRLVVAECAYSDVARWSEDPVVQFMASCQYRPVAKTVHSVIFEAYTS